MEALVVRLGNTRPHQKPVTPDASDVDALHRAASDLGVSTDGSPETLASRVRAATPFEQVAVADGYTGEETQVTFPDVCQTCYGKGKVPTDSGDTQTCFSCSGSGDFPIGDAFRDVTDSGRGLWRAHSSEAPAWVESNNPALQAMLAAHYGAAEGKPGDGSFRDHGMFGDTPDDLAPSTARIKRPGEDGFDEGTSTITDSTIIDSDAPLTAEQSGARGRGGGMMPLGFLMLGLIALWQLISAHLRTNAGGDFQSRVMGDTASTGTGIYAAANFIALTENVGPPAAGHTTLAGELVDSGLARAQATYAHTTGTTSYTLTKTFTSGTATPRTIQMAGVLNAASAGSLVFESAVTNPPTLQQNDQLTITETVNIA